MKTVRAFTLVELMVTIAVLAILATLAAPNLSSVLNNSKVKTSTGDIFNFLQQARTEAIRLGEPVIVCASADGTNCVTSNKTNWAIGIISKTMRSDANKDISLQKLAFDHDALVVTAPDAIAFNTVGSTNGRYEVIVSLSSADISYICVEVIGRARKSKVEC